MNEQQQFTDLSLLTIGDSVIHGRGVLVTKDVSAGDDLGLLWFDFYRLSSYCSSSQSTSDLVRLTGSRGFIPDGGSLRYADMTVAEALETCREWSECHGFTFRDPAIGGVCSSAGDGSDGKIECSDAIVESLEFKDKGAVIEDQSWISFARPSREVAFHPLGCNAPFYPDGVRIRAQITSANARSCWPRWVNHACNATVDISFHDLIGDANSIPCLPWAHCVRAVRAVALRDLKAGEEITLNYELLPKYMQREVAGVLPCSKQGVQQHGVQQHSEL